MQQFPTGEYKANSVVSGEGVALMNQPKHDTDGTKKRSVSIRKVEANRKNALKSTGPRTLRGKAYSRRNAIKHGLFARQFMDFFVHGEDPTEYEEVLNGFRARYDPIGVAEELEVERLAQCWWRLKRVWRYENAMNRVALRDSGRKELADQAKWCEERGKEDDAVILELESAVKEIEETGAFPQELRQRIFALNPGSESIWIVIESVIQERIAVPRISKMLEQLNSEERSSVLAPHIATAAIGYLKQLARWRFSSVLEIAVAQHVIPNSNALDKILRYEPAIERQLGRSFDRLERLQRGRNAEMIPPPLSVHLMR